MGIVLDKDGGALGMFFIPPYLSETCPRNLVKSKFEILHGK
jgi:hypothetical protein